MVGDETYGNNDWNKKMKKSDQVYRPLLHAYETEFVHPFTNEKILLNAPLPPDMFNLITKNKMLLKKDGFKVLILI